MCETANQLRAAWYRTVTIIPQDADDKTREQLFREQRDNPEYRMALKALREHISGCDICKRGWRR